MTTETITIVVNEKGARVVNRSLSDVGKTASKSQTGVDQLNRALRTLGGTLSAVAVLRLADSYTNLQNRLKLVTDGTGELNAVTKSLFDISNNTRSSYEATAEVYARTALATKDLGLSQQQTLDFTKSLNQAVILSGASAQEAQAGMIQLSQGLASGTLRGDELRSVLEQLPKVADTIAESMGVTRGELREMGQDGKIGARDIILAFQKASSSLESDFGKTVPTVAQSIVILKNNFQQLIGQMDETYKVTTTLSKGLVLISENLETIGKVLLIAGTAWAAYRAQIILTTAATAAAGIAQTIIAFVQLAATVRTAAQATALFNLVVAANPIVFLISAIAAVTAGLFLFRKQIFETLREIDVFGVSAAEIFATMGDIIVGHFKGVFEVFSTIIAKMQVKLFKFADSINQVFGKEIIPLDNIISSNAPEVMERAGRNAVEAYKKGFQDQLDNGFLNTERNGGLFTDKITAPIDLGAGGGADLTGNANAVSEAIKRQKDLLEEIQAPALDYQLAVSDLNTLYDDGLISLQEYNNEMAKQEGQFLQNFEATTFADGFIAQIRRMQLETRNATAKMGTDFAKIFGPGGSLSKGVGDAIAQSIVFGKSWQESIRQVAQSILTQLISSLVQVGVNMLLNAVLGKTLMAASTAASAAAGSATAAAWAPAAAMASLASFGANAGPAMAGMSATMALSKTLSSVGGGLPGFESGGYTGNGGRSQVAGLVHGQEFVMNATATAKNRASLEAMNRGESIGENSNKGMSVYIVNEIPDAEFESTQLSENEVEIIARRVVRQDAPGVIASDLSNSNGRVSKALSKNTQTMRRRP